MRWRVVWRWMTTAVMAVAVTVPLWGGGSGPEQAPASEDPDVLFRDREQLPAAVRAAEIWAGRLSANPRDFEAAWKLARARSWIGERSPRHEEKAHFEQGLKAAAAAIALEPRRPEGYFWQAVNMGLLADGSPIVAGLKYRVPIRESLETVIRLDPQFQRGVGYCALGKYYLQVPWLFGGRKMKAEQLIRRCLAQDPANAMGHYFLAQTLLALDRLPEARIELQRTIAAPVDAEFGPEVRNYQRKAQRLLRKIGE